MSISTVPKQVRTTLKRANSLFSNAVHYLPWSRLQKSNNLYPSYIYRIFMSCTTNLSYFNCTLQVQSHFLKEVNQLFISIIRTAHLHIFSHTDIKTQPQLIYIAILIYIGIKIFLLFSPTFIILQVYQSSHASKRSTVNKRHCTFRSSISRTRYLQCLNA